MLLLPFWWFRYEGEPDYSIECSESSDRGIPLAEVKVSWPLENKIVHETLKGVEDRVKDQQGVDAFARFNLLDDPIRGAPKVRQVEGAQITECLARNFQSPWVVFCVSLSFLSP